MDYRICPHYEEILHVLAENRDLEDISFEIDDLRDCTECIYTNEDIPGVCKLWILLAFVHDMRPQLGIEDAKLTIENLDKQLQKIAIDMIKALRKPENDED